MKSTDSTTIINLYGGPGTGKSTSAAFLYWLLKTAGVNAELAREYVKKWAWEGRHLTPYDQPYIVGKQAREESMLYGRARVVLSDSPVLMAAVYARLYAPDFERGCTGTALDLYRKAALDGHSHVHVLLRRSKPYNPAGRYQTEAEARGIDGAVAALLAEHEIPFIQCGTEEAELLALARDLEEKGLLPPLAGLAKSKAA